MVSCTCQVAGPVTECDGTWLCSSCYAKSDLKDFGCGDELSANRKHHRGPGRRRLSPTKRTALPKVRMGAMHAGKRVSQLL